MPFVTSRKLVVYRDVCLGKGNFAEVYCGKLNDKLVAVKVFRVCDKAKQSQIEDLQREVNFLL